MVVDLGTVLQLLTILTILGGAMGSVVAIGRWFQKLRSDLNYSNQKLDSLNQKVDAMIEATRVAHAAYLVRIEGVDEKIRTLQGRASRLESKLAVLEGRVPNDT